MIEIPRDTPAFVACGRSGLPLWPPPAGPLPAVEDVGRRPDATVWPALPVQGVRQPRGHAVRDREPGRARHHPASHGGAETARHRAHDA
jgi:hypothetical protein